MISLQRDTFDLEDKDLEFAFNSEFVPEILARMEGRLSARGFDDPDCWTLLSCRSNRPLGNTDEDLEAVSSDVEAALREIFDSLKDKDEKNEELDATTLKHFYAMRFGASAQDCAEAFPGCKSTYEDMIDAIENQVDS